MTVAQHLCYNFKLAELKITSLSLRHCLTQLISIMIEKLVCVACVACVAGLRCATAFWRQKLHHVICNFIIICICDLREI